MRVGSLLRGVKDFGGGFRGFFIVIDFWTHSTWWTISPQYILYRTVSLGVIHDALQ
jgi:hypothetical protein